MSAQPPADNLGSLSLLANNSDCRRQTARHVATLWQEHWPRSTRVVDFGAGDGGLLSEILDYMPTRPHASLIEPDQHSASEAVARLVDKTTSVAIVDGLESLDSLDVCLAAHVLYYVPDLESWLNAVISRMAQEATLTVVLTDLSCPMYALRGIVRSATGRRPRITMARLLDGCTAHGLTPSISRVESTFAYEVFSPVISEIPADSDDPSLGRLICWLTGLDPTSQLEPTLLGPINEFLLEHYHKRWIRWEMRDSVIHMRRSS